jgi:RNA polymerase sigma factor (TIGR02999 family)
MVASAEPSGLRRSLDASAADSENHEQIGSRKGGPDEMPPNEPGVTQLLEAHRRGDPDALERLMPLLYGELRRLAAYYLRAERPDHTLQPTALVHEAYLRLAEQREMHWRDRAHFFALAAQVMRHILVDHARARRTSKRGKAQVAVPLDDAADEMLRPDLDFVALDDALRALEQNDAQQSRIVEMRYFGGLTIEETAEVLGISPATVKRDWTMAKAWLRREIASR